MSRAVAVSRLDRTGHAQLEASDALHTVRRARRRGVKSTARPRRKGLPHEEATIIRPGRWPWRALPARPGGQIICGRSCGTAASRRRPRLARLGCSCRAAGRERCWSWANGRHGGQCAFRSSARATRRSASGQGPGAASQAARPAVPTSPRYRIAKAGPGARRWPSQGLSSTTRTRSAPPWPAVPPGTSGPAKRGSTTGRSCRDHFAGHRDMAMRLLDEAIEPC